MFKFKRGWTKKKPTHTKKGCSFNIVCLKIFNDIYDCNNRWFLFSLFFFDIPDIALQMLIRIIQIKWKTASTHTPYIVSMFNMAQTMTSLTTLCGDERKLRKHCEQQTNGIFMKESRSFVSVKLLAFYYSSQAIDTCSGNDVIIESSKSNWTNITMCFSFWTHTQTCVCVCFFRLFYHLCATFFFTLHILFLK